MKGFVSKVVWAKFVLLAALLTSGCATKQYHDWYEGDKQAGAVVTSKETILIESINGRATDSNFIGQVHSFELPPGEYAMVVTYADIFDKTADDFEKVKSNPVKLTFVVEASKQYVFNHQEINKLAEAESFAEKPIFQIIDVASGDAIEANSEYTTPRSILARLMFESEEEQVFPSDYLNRPKPAAKTVAPAVASKSDKESSTLKMLKFSWQEASQEDRARFMEWLNQK